MVLGFIEQLAPFVSVALKINHFMKTAWSTWEQLSHMDSDACSGGGVERWKLKMLINEEEK